MRAPLITPRRTRRATALALVVAAGLSLAACGGSSESATTADGLTKVTVLAPPVRFEAFTYAEEHGIFEKHGLEVEAKEAGAADAALTEVVSGTATFAAASGVAAVTAGSQEIPVKIVVGNSANAVTNDSGVLVAKGSGITSIKDLTGKKVGINGLRNTTELLVATGIDEAGGDSSQTDFVEMPYPAMSDALKRGTVDAIYTVAPFYDDSAASGLARVDNPVSAPGGTLAGLPSVAWVASDAYLASNADTVADFQAAMEEAYTYLNGHPAESKAITAANSELTPAQIEAQQFVPFSAPVGTAPLTASIAKMKEYGWIESEPAVDDVLAATAPRD